MLKAVGGRRWALGVGQFAIFSLQFAIGSLVLCETPERLEAIWEKRQNWLKTYSAPAPKASPETTAIVRRARDTSRAIEQERQRLDSLEKELAGIPNVRRRGELKKEIKAANQKIVGLEERLGNLESEKRASEPSRASRAELVRDFSLWNDLSVNAMKAGDVGKFPFPAGIFVPLERLFLLRVANGEKLAAADLERLAGFGDVEAIQAKHNIRIVQVIDGENALATVYDIGIRQPLNTPVFWLRGIDTSDMADDSTMHIDAVMEITGTTKYETASGSMKTVLVIEPFDVEQCRQFLNPEP